MKRFAANAALALFGVLLIVSIGAAIAIASMVRSGLGTNVEPTRAEAFAARMVRRWAVPSAMRDAKNPVAATPEVLADGRAHFADHCASCHGNDGKGDAMGKRMYPRAPDMTLAATQSLSDGELFAVIEHGVRLTGMPGFGDGTPASAKSSWALVHFIRHLPKLTPAELVEMQKLNPMSRDEFEQLVAEEEFLGGAATSEEKHATATTVHH